MKNTGIVRKIDELGRIVLPKELRRTLNIHSGDDFYIGVEDNKIILERYAYLKSFEEKIISIIESFSMVNNYKILISINDKIINTNEIISNEVSSIIQSRKMYVSDKVSTNIISNNIKIEGKIVVLPIVDNSDLMGGIIVISNDDINVIEMISKIILNLIKKIIVSN